MIVVHVKQKDTTLVHCGSDKQETKEVENRTDTLIPNGKPNSSVLVGNGRLER